MITANQALPELKKELSRGRLIIFVGSGISTGSDLPTWDGFLDDFISFCQGLSSQYQSYKISSVFTPDLFKDALAQRARYPTQVATVLKHRLTELPTNIRTNVENDFKKWFFRLFANADPNEQHRHITSTNYPFILTSNYDTLLEDAAKEIGSPYSSLSFSQAPLIAESIYTNSPSIIHVHGTCSDVLLEKIILTSDDYTKIIKKQHPGFSFSLQSMFLRYSTLFVGYGASDPHLEDLIEEFALYFDYTKSDNLSKNYLVLHEEKTGEIMDHYKSRLRTEIISVPDFSVSNELIAQLSQAAPRQGELL